MADEAWKQYPSHWSGSADELSLDEKDAIKRLEDEDGVYFVEEEEDINVRVTDVDARKWSFE